jgi:hypothetical protein
LTAAEFSVGAFTDAQHVLLALVIDAHGSDYALLAKEHAVDVDNQNVHILEAPAEQL